MKFKDIQSDCPWMVPNYGVNKKNACSVVSTPTHLNTCRKEKCGFWAWQAKYGERKEMTTDDAEKRECIADHLLNQLLKRVLAVGFSEDKLSLTENHQAWGDIQHSVGSLKTLMEALRLEEEIRVSKLENKK